MTNQIRQNRKTVPQSSGADLPVGLFERFTPQTISTGSNTAIQWRSFTKSTGATHVSWTSGTPQNVTIHESGWYQFNLHTKWTTPTGNVRVLGDYGPSATDDGSGVDLHLAVSWCAYYDASAGAFSVTETVFQNSGGDVDLDEAYLSVIKVSGQGAV